MKKVLMIIMFLSLSVTSFAMDVTLQWDENADADYYVISYGQESGTYTQVTEKIQKPTTTYTFTGLEDKTYYFAVKAFNLCGNSSDFSDEVSNGVLPGVVTSVVVKTCVTYEAR